MNEQVAMSEEYAKGLRWWRYYRFPLVPQWRYRPADKQNNIDWSFHWLALRVWTNIAPQFGFDVELCDQNLRVSVSLPYLHVALLLPIFPEKFSMWSHAHLWRTPRRK